MELFGRVTANARIAQTKTGKEVVNFSIAINKRFRVKATGELKSRTTFVEVSYWRNTGIAAYLLKGSTIVVHGDLGVRAYIGKDGNAKGVITFNAQDIEFFGSKQSNVSSQPAAAITEPVDDLPF